MPDLAENLARLRKARDLSQEALAAAAGVGIDTVARIERGTRTVCRPQTLDKLAAALGVSARVLQGGPAASRGDVHDAVRRLRQAISAGTSIPGLDDFAETTETLDATEVEAATARTWRLYVDGRHTQLLNELPIVLTDCRRLAHTGENDGAAQRHLATAYRIAAGIAGRLGHDDLAWNAGERALAAARQSDQPEIQAAVSMRYLTWTLVRQGRNAEAEHVATRAAEAVQPRFLDHDPDRTAVFGNLLFNAATAATNTGAAARAADLLAEARSAAARTMVGVVSEAGIFSQRAVTIQEVEHLTRTDDPVLALRRAFTLEPEGERLPAFWEAGHALQLASASLRSRRADAALNYLDLAYQLAPDWATVQPLGRNTMLALLDRTSRRRGNRFAALATAYGALDG